MRYDEHGIPLVGPEPDDPDAERKADKKAQRAYEDKQTSLQNRILATQVVIVFFGIIAAGVSVWQARTAQESADTADKSVLISQRAERDTRIINEKQLLQSQKSLQATIENFHVDERAYMVAGGWELSSDGVHVSNGLARFSEGIRFCIRTHYRNTGRTPALGVIEDDRLTYGNEAKKTIYGFVARPKSGYGYTAIPSTEKISDFHDACSDVLDADNRELLTSGSIPIYVYGSVRYTDIFGDDHETRFCGVRPANQIPFGDCSFGNWIDHPPKR